MEARRRSVVLSAYQGKTPIQAANRRQNPPLFGPSISRPLLTINRETTSPLTTSTASGMTPEQEISTFTMTKHCFGTPAMTRARA